MKRKKLQNPFQVGILYYDRVNLIQVGPPDITSQVGGMGAKNPALHIRFVSMWITVVLKAELDSI